MTIYRRDVLDGILPSLENDHMRKSAASLKKDFLSALGATSIGTLVLGAAAYALQIQQFSPVLLVAFWLISTAATVIMRKAVRLFLKSLAPTDHRVRHVLVVGTNHRALRFCRAIDGKSDRYQIVGFVDDSWDGADQAKQQGHRVVSDFNGFSDYIKSHVIDEVVIFLPFKSLYDKSTQLVDQCTEQGITVRFAPGILDPKFGQPSISHLEGYPLVTVTTGALRGRTVHFKRCIDIFVSALALLALFPIMLGVAMAIKLSSKGPVFFAQERIGLNKRRFRMFKFRTMVQDAEAMMAKLEQFNEAEGPVFKMKSDPRITGIGKFLRKTSLDELPQLINVLIGDMSLVGPRPLPVRDYEGFSQDWHRRRFSVRPGITCLWQIMGRSSIPFEQWMELDMEYIDRWSLWLDLKILVLTIPSITRGVGAF